MSMTNAKVPKKPAEFDKDYMYKPFVTIEQVKQILSIRTTTVYKLIKEEKIIKTAVEGRTVIIVRTLLDYIKDATERGLRGERQSARGGRRARKPPRDADETVAPSVSNHSSLPGSEVRPGGSKINHDMEGAPAAPSADDTIPDLFGRVPGTKPNT